MTIPLTGIPEPLPFLAETGEVLSNLCLAIFSAWLFNLLVIELPAVRRREAIITSYLADLEVVANMADLIITALYRKKGQTPSEEPTVEEMVDVFRTIRSDSRAGAYFFRDTLTSGTLDWYEYLERHLDDMHDAIRRLGPAITYLDWEVSAGIGPIANTRFEEFVRNTRRFSTKGPNLEELAEPLHEFLSLSRPLKNYVESLAK